MAFGPDGVPQAFLWAGAWHPITRIASRWRVNTGWWAPDVEAWQEYVKLTTADDLFCILAHDLGDGEWRMIRLFD
jgi:hypothetical protein